MAILYGVNAVREALASGQAIERINIARGRHGQRVQAIVEACRRQNIPVRFVERGELDRLVGSASHQGVVAVTAAQGYRGLEELVANAKKPGLLVALDGVEDPRNLGAILRTSHCAGADGVVIPERRAAGLSETVAKTSAGATAYLPVAQVTNLARALEELKAASYWVIGLDERAKQTYDAVDLTDSVVLVLGGEGGGLHELVRKKCDFLVSIPTLGRIASLNVSVAAGIVLYEVLRQRKMASAPSGIAPS
jgi:23S rRNA (guanosine2251-2'-O)-methyltransferase